MRLRVKYLIYFLGFFISPNIYADYEAPVAITNVNEKTNFFESNVENASGFEDMIKSHKNTYGVEGNEASGIQDIINLNDSNVMSDVESLKSLNSSDLESRGRDKMLSPEGDEIIGIYPNLNDPLLHREKGDLEEIAKNTSDALDGFMSKLKDVGIDCKEEAGNRMAEPDFVIGEQKTILDSNYDQSFCEELKNTYQCKRHLTVKCHQKNLRGFASSTFRMNGSNPVIPLNYNVDSGALTIGRFPTSYTHNGGKGTSYSYDINFNIADVNLVSEFNLRTVGYDDLIRISVNGRQVFIGPYSGDRLELVTSEQIYGFNQWWYKVRINGSGSMVSAETNIWKSVTPNINLKGYLQKGSNTINITLIVGGGGGFNLAFVARSLACDYLREEWRETCVHQK